jgi:hypothetical protein
MDTAWSRRWERQQRARYRIGPVKPRFTVPRALICVGLLSIRNYVVTPLSFPASLRRWRHPRACKFEPHLESSSLFKSSPPPAHALSMNFPPLTHTPSHHPLRIRRGPCRLVPFAGSPFSLTPRLTCLLFCCLSRAITTLFRFVHPAFPLRPGSILPQKLREDFLAQPIRLDSRYEHQEPISLFPFLLSLRSPSLLNLT